MHRYDPHTYVLRQNKSVSYEAPFLFLLKGNARALLLDTGASQDPAACPVRETVDQILDRWLAEHPRAGYELVVAHTHGHGDHVGGDSQFAGRLATTVVGRELAAVQQFFGFTGWPGQIVRLDLGGRILEITGSPGHQRAAITLYDPWSGFLLTGDTVYRGRLYVQDFPAFLASLDRLVELAGSRPVTHVLGCHIEMTLVPGRDYPVGSTYQPDEPPLQMTVAQLAAVRDAARSVSDRPGAHAFADFIIFHGPSHLAVIRQLGRTLWAKIRPPGRRGRPG